MCMLQSLWAGVAPDIRGQLYSDISPYRVSEYSLFRPCVTVLCFTIVGHRASPWFFIIVFCTHFLTNFGSTFLRKCNLFVIGCIEPLSDRANQRLTCEKNGFNVFTHLAPRREIYTPKKLFFYGPPSSMRHLRPLFSLFSVFFNQTSILFYNKLM